MRPRSRDRGVPHGRVLDHRSHDGDRQARGVRRPPHRHRRQAPRQARSQGRGHGERHQGRHREGRLQDRLRRQEGREAQPVPAVRHLDPADGRLPQARLLGQADHAARPAPVRGRRHRRRDGGPHHLHANGRRHHHSRGGERHPRPDRARVFAALRRPVHPRVQDQGQERAGSARGRAPDRHLAPPAGRHAPSRARPGPPLRADLEAHRGEPNGECRARADHGRHRGERPRRQALHVTRLGLRGAVRWLPPGL